MKQTVKRPFFEWTVYWWMNVAYVLIFHNPSPNCGASIENPTKPKDQLEKSSAKSKFVYKYYF